MPSYGLPAGPGVAVLDVEWMRRAACVLRTDLPWTLDGTRMSWADRLTMAGVCASCPVLGRCTDYAMRARVTGGYWAGMVRDEPQPAAGDGAARLRTPSGDVGGAA